MGVSLATGVTAEGQAGEVAMLTVASLEDQLSLGMISMAAFSADEVHTTGFATNPQDV